MSEVGLMLADLGLAYGLEELIPTYVQDSDVQDFEAKLASRS